MRVARTTALEGLQQPVCLLLTVAALVFTGLQPLVHMHAFGEGGRLTRDSGLAVMLVFGLLVVVLTSGSTLARELSSGTVAAALAKPISRTGFLIGKFLGTVAVIALFCWCGVFAVLFAERTAERYVETARLMGHLRDTTCGRLALLMPVLALVGAAGLNWRCRRRFGLWFFLMLSVLQPLLMVGLGFLGRDGVRHGLSDYSLALDFRVLPAAALVALLLAVFAGLATTLSTRLQTGAAVTVSFVVLFLGFLADSQLGGAAAWPLRLLYAAVPDVQHFWVVDALAEGGRIPGAYVLKAAVYAITYMGGVLLLGACSFKHRDLG